MKKLGKLFLMLSMLVTTVLSGQVQHESEKSKEERRAQIEAQKVAFLTAQMELTPEEATKFWPVYQKYEKKRKSLREEGHSMKKGKKLEDLTDVEMTQMVDHRVDVNIQLAELDRAYIDELKGILPIRKVMLMHKAERDFKRQIMRKMKGKGKR